MSTQEIFMDKISKYSNTQEYSRINFNFQQTEYIFSHHNIIG